MRYLIESGNISKQDEVLDYGCGYGLDAAFLNDLGFNVKNYDKYNPKYADTAFLCRHFDIVTCNYVLNVIPNLDFHRALVAKLRLLADTVYLTVRVDSRAIKANWRYDPEALGYWTGRGTFQRFYDRSMIDDLLSEAKILKISSCYAILEIKGAK